MYHTFLALLNEAGSSIGDPPWQLERVQVDGIQVAYATAGPPEAEPIVLLHGYVGSHLSWRHQIGPLAERYRVIAPDWPGWGASARNPSVSYAYEAEVARLGRLLDRLELSPCNLAGHDYGGFLALGLCQREPERLRRLALLNSRAHRSFTPAWYVLFAAIGLAARTPGAAWLLQRLPLAAIHKGLLRPAVKAGAIAPACLDSYVAWMSDDPLGPPFFVRFHADYHVAVRPELARGLPAITCPTAVVWGVVDEYLDARIAHELERRIPRAKLTLIYDAGHFVNEERPQAVLDALEELLAVPVGS